ncbi:MAG TPA: GTP-binding protein, partial [Bryobacteraceae bacterium]|nr:GTP-binding protein [Bryobacteraceae bacterium]
MRETHPVPLLVLVGGFLGAGKTTLLLRAAERLSASGKRVALVMNDQGGELVDTRAARSAGFAAGEVAGGCFCCRLSEFLACSERLLAEHRPEVILAEPVGSCTDLAATIFR